MHNSILFGAEALSCAMIGTTGASPVKIEKEQFSKYGECLKLSNGEVEVFVTTEFGPRVICYRFVNGQNILAELPLEEVNKTDLGDWHPYGGHRLWHAPESMPRSYVPDNDPVKAEAVGKSTIRVAPALETATGIQKEMYISLDREGSGVTITHTLTNRGMWPVELAPWALTIMNGGGTTIFPQEPFKPHGEVLLPARPMALWSYTDLSDSRWSFGKKLIRLKCDPASDSPQKIGVANKQGWAAYAKDNLLFMKRFTYDGSAKYPDYGCNFETFTRGSFMEIETVGHLSTINPGESVTHVEHWYLFSNVQLGDTDDSVSAALTPLVHKTEIR